MILDASGREMRRKIGFEREMVPASEGSADVHVPLIGFSMQIEEPEDGFAQGAASARKFSNG